MVPLLSIRRWLVAGIVLLAGCQSPPSSPPFAATGYIADGGIVRIGRLEGRAQQPLAMMRVFSPLGQGQTLIDHYRYRDGHLYQILQQSGDDEGDVLQLRFDMQGTLSYMQRLQGETREMPSADEIAKAQYQARHTRDLAATLIAGGVSLVQGRWQDGIFTRCDGQVAPLPLAGWQAAQLARREANSHGALWVAWLSAPAGVQLLQITQQDICAWEPTAKTL